MSLSALKKRYIYILIAALNNSERGIGKLKLDWDEDAILMLADMSSGDARIALDKLGFISENLKKNSRIDKNIIKEAMQRQATFTIEVRTSIICFQLFKIGARK